MEKQRKVKNLALYENTKPEGSVIDAHTGHAFIEKENGEIIELKRCKDCGRWLPLNNFLSGTKNNDGLQCECRKCWTSRATLYRKQKNGLCSKPVIVKTQGVEIPASVQGEVKDKMKELIDAVTAPYRKRISELEAKIAEMGRNKVDLSKLTDTEFENLVMTRKNVAPRVYFNAIKKLDSRYTFSCYDSNTGLTTVIKTEVA